MHLIHLLMAEILWVTTWLLSLNVVSKAWMSSKTHWWLISFSVFFNCDPEILTFDSICYVWGITIITMRDNYSWNCCLPFRCIKGRHFVLSCCYMDHFQHETTSIKRFSFLKAKRSSGLSLLATFFVIYGPVVINSQNHLGVYPIENSVCLAELYL